jgi:hypothetical protein
MAATARRTTVIASGLLCCALTLVVLFSGPRAFRSPTAVVVMALIGTAAVLIQLRLRNDNPAQGFRPPLWLNVLGIALALAALFPTPLRIGPRLAQVMVFGAVGSLAITSAIILHGIRKPSPKHE